MKFTAHSDCATEGLEERIDQLDETAGKDVHVRECLQRITDKIGCIRNALTRSRATSEEFEALKDLEDEITDLQGEMIRLIVTEMHDDNYIAFYVGLRYGQLLERRKHKSQGDGRRHE